MKYCQIESRHNTMTSSSIYAITNTILTREISSSLLTMEEELERDLVEYLDESRPTTPNNNSRFEIIGLTSQVSTTILSNTEKTDVIQRKGLSEQPLVYRLTESGLISLSEYIGLIDETSSMTERVVSHLVGGQQIILYKGELCSDWSWGKEIFYSHTGVFS
jgi:hypothetical protein